MSMTDHEQLEAQLEGMREMLRHAEDIVSDSLDGTDEGHTAYMNGLALIATLRRRYNRIALTRRSDIEFNALRKSA